jgi:catechol 2,3-dioxygenase-like lactoylglutathione lyase family enzyme
VIDHVTLRVSDFHASKAFYQTVLAPLGYAAPWSDEEQRAADWATFRSRRTTSR